MNEQSLVTMVTMFVVPIQDVQALLRSLASALTLLPKIESKNTHALAHTHMHISYSYIRSVSPEDASAVMCALTYIHCRSPAGQPVVTQYHVERPLYSENHDDTNMVV